MKKWKAGMGYTAAALTMLAAVLVPFVLTGTFTRVFAGLGLHVDEMYSGGPVVRTIQTGRYAIDVHREVFPHMLQQEGAFVQLDWKPVNALPAHLDDAVDIDGDGKPDVRVSFDVPQDEKAPHRADIESFNPHFASVQNLRKQKFSALIVRVDDAIVVRVPLAR